MKKLFSAILGAAIFAGASFTAYAAPGSGEGTPESYYWWNHPRLGMVKVDRATNKMVQSKRSTQAVNQTAESASPSR